MPAKTALFCNASRCDGVVDDGRTHVRGPQPHRSRQQDQNRDADPRAPGVSDRYRSRHFGFPTRHARSRLQRRRLFAVLLLESFRGPGPGPRDSGDQAYSLLVWGSAVVAKAVRDATTTTPVVFADVADPVKNGLVASLAHPGGNMTGLTNVTEELVAKRIELLKEALPSLTRIAVLGNLTNPEQPPYFRVAQEAARRLNAEARLYPVETQANLAAAFSNMEADHMQAVLLLPDAWFYPLRTEIVALAAKHRIPAIYGNTAYADAEGLFVYGVNLSSLNVKVIVYLDKILKGAKPGDLPVERPSQFDFIVNQRTA